MYHQLNDVLNQPSKFIIFRKKKIITEDLSALKHLPLHKKYFSTEI